MKLAKATVELISSNCYEDMLKKIEQMGRICYKSENNIREDSAAQFIQKILQRGHESVIEHESISIKVICDRGVTHEIVRHRLASYSQESTRYCNYTNEKFEQQITCIDLATGFQYDMSKESDKLKYTIWQQAMNDAEKHYFAMIEAGASPQEARSVLPNSLKTEIMITMNLRQWRHFFRLRTAPASHPQMREVAQQILDMFKNEFPLFFEDIL